MRWVGKAPLIIKVVLVVAALFLWPFLLPFTLLTSAVAVVQKRPGRGAAYATATWVFRPASSTSSGSGRSRWPSSRSRWPGAPGPRG